MGRKMSAWVGDDIGPIIPALDAYLQISYV